MREIIGYILYTIVAAVGLIIVYVLFGQAERSLNTDQFSSQVSSFKTAMTRHYSRRAGRYGNAQITDANLITMGVAPQDTQFSTTELRNPWGGAIDVTGNGNTFFLDTDSIPQEDCIALLHTLTTSLGIKTVRVAASLAGVGGATAHTLPTNDNDAISACGNASNAVRLEIQ